MKKRLFAVCFLVCFTVTLCGCTTFYNPATERRETLLIDTPSEVALGKDLDVQMQKEVKVINVAELQKRLEAVGYQLAAVSDRQDLTYHFRVVDDDTLNAFALPGGFIYVNDGLMKAATDDELACVVAHEIGHVAARHSVKRLQTTLGYQLVMSIVLGMSGQSAVGSAMNVVFDLVNLGYSRGDELLADKLSVKYAKKADFDPYAMVTFFRKLEQEAKEKGYQSHLVFLSSHPAIEERIKRIEQEISSEKHITTGPALL